MRRGLELKWPELSSQIQSKSMHPLSKVQPAPLQHQNWTGGGAGPGAARGHWGATPRGLCILCAPKGARTARAQHKAVRLLHFRVLSAPHAPACRFPPSPPSPRAAGVGWSPQGCLRSKESVLPISGEVLSSQGQDANSQWQQRGEASPGSLPSLGKPLECEKRHLSCQGGQECKQLLCAAHPAGSELSTCHAGTVTLHTTEPTCPQLPARLSQAHGTTSWTSKGGSLNPSHALRSLKVLCFLSEISCPAVLKQREGMELRPGEKSSCVNTHTSIPDVIRQKTQ